MQLEILLRSLTGTYGYFYVSYYHSFFFPLSGLDVNTRFCVEISGAVTSKLQILDHFGGQVSLITSLVLKTLAYPASIFVRF